MSTFAQARHWLVPHGGNSHHPRLLRREGVALVVGLVLALQLVFNLAATGKPSVLGFATDINAFQILNLTNHSRETLGLSALAQNPSLDAAAQAKASDMIAGGYWSHTSPQGITPWSFVTQAGYSYSYAGENLARGFQTSAGVVEGWLKSPRHRANVLDSRYRDIGLAVMNGRMDGRDTTLVVALYGAPKSIPGLVSGAYAAERASGPVSYGLLNPLWLGATLDWAAKLALGAAIAFLAVYLNAHRVRRRRKVRGHRHGYALPQALLSLAFIATVAVTSFGTVH